MTGSDLSMPKVVQGEVDEGLEWVRPRKRRDLLPVCNAETTLWHSGKRGISSVRRWPQP